MPEICRFYGIVIRLYFDDHPPPHFHAAYGGHEAVVNVQTRSLLAGDLPPRAQTAAVHPLPIDVRFPAALIAAPGRELSPPGAPHDDGFYWCLYELWSDDVETVLSLSSRRNFNSEAWVTACELLDRVGSALGGEARDY